MIVSPRRAYGKRPIPQDLLLSPALKPSSVALLDGQTILAAPRNSVVILYIVLWLHKSNTSSSCYKARPTSALNELPISHTSYAFGPAPHFREGTTTIHAEQVLSRVSTTIVVATHVQHHELMLQSYDNKCCSVNK